MKDTVTVGDLRRLLENVPDDVPVLTPGPDHSYFGASARLSSALLEEGGTWTEDYGEETTPEKVYGKRLQAIIIR